MEAAKVLAGYSLGEADLLRRAMGKKIQSEMDAQRARFIEGAAKNDISPGKANELFDLIDKFAGYGFNKSHAAAYALVAYWPSEDVGISLRRECESIIREMGGNNLSGDERESRIRSCIGARARGGR